MLLLLALAWYAAAAEPENFIPKQAPGVIRININRMLTSPELKEILDNNKEIKKLVDAVNDMLKNASGSKLKLSDIFSSQLWIAQTGKKQKDVTAYCKTALPEKVLQTAVSKNPACKVVDAAGKKAFVYERAGKNLVVLYLADDVLMLSCLSDRLPQEVTASLQGGGNPLLSTIDRQMLAAGAVDMAAVTGQRKPKIRFISGKLDFNKALDLTSQVILHCKSSQEALKMAMQIQFAAPGFIGMFFSKDENLAAALAEGLQVTPQNDAIIIDYSLKYTDFQKAVKYMSKAENRPLLPENKGVGPEIKQEKK